MCPCFLPLPGAHSKHSGWVGSNPNSSRLSVSVSSSSRLGLSCPSSKSVGAEYSLSNSTSELFSLSGEETVSVMSISLFVSSTSLLLFGPGPALFERVDFLLMDGDLVIAVDRDEFLLGEVAANVVDFDGGFLVTDGDFLVPDGDFLVLLATDGDFEDLLADILGFFKGELGMVSVVVFEETVVSDWIVFCALLIRMFCSFSALLAKSKR